MIWSHWPVYERVLVNLLDGNAISGVLVDKRGPLLILADATLLTPGGNGPQAMDGHVYVERSQIAFLQATHAKGG